MTLPEIPLALVLYLIMRSHIFKYIYLYLTKFAQNNTFISGLYMDTLLKKYNGAALYVTSAIVQGMQCISIILQIKINQFI